MYRKGLIFIIVLLFFLTSLSMAAPGGAGETVYIIPLEGPVEKGLLRFLTRSFQEAERAGASMVILEINTPGGFLDAAFDVSSLIREQEMPVHAYVKNKALSAGAYLALSCDKIFMAPGGVIGAAEPRSFVAGEEGVDEKTISAWAAAMESVAEAAGKDPQLAEAMVRKEVSIEGVVEEGRLLTLTSKKAAELNFSDGTFHSRRDLLNYLELEEASLIETDEKVAERIARMITDPTIATILLTVAMAALMLELTTAGFGVAGFVSMASFALFFGGHIFAGLAGYEVLVLFVLGIILLLIEAFLPSFGIVGAAGLGGIATAVVLSAADAGQGLLMFSLSFLFSIVIAAFSFRALNRKGFFNRIILSYQEEKTLGYVGPRSYSDLQGKKGMAVTPLRPAGTALIEGKRQDVVTEGGFIAAGAEIEVVQVEGVRIVVRLLVDE